MNLLTALYLSLFLILGALFGAASWHINHTAAVKVSAARSQ
jgi:hypothetical protein